VISGLVLQQVAGGAAGKLRERERIAINWYG
jgi:hypothetical protein